MTTDHATSPESIKLTKTNAGSQYRDPEYWRTLSITPSETERMAATVGLVPDDVSTIVDVGCGDGRLSRALRENWDVVSVDLSEAAVRATGAKAILASASRLPFSDGAFDLVCSTEMLEHLSETDYVAAISEMARVARKYVLISVPAAEDLADGTTRCRKCGAYYHLWGHLRRFTDNDLENLSPKLKLITHLKCGKEKHKNHATRWIRRKIGRQYPTNPHVTCPECGEISGERQTRNLVTYACALAELIIPTPHIPRFSICLYGRV